jgi:hypothetical protein
MSTYAQGMKMKRDTPGIQFPTDCILLNEVSQSSVDNYREGKHTAPPSLQVQVALLVWNVSFMSKTDQATKLY